MLMCFMTKSPAEPPKMAYGLKLVVMELRVEEGLAVLTPAHMLKVGPDLAFGRETFIPDQ